MSRGLAVMSRNQLLIADLELAAGAMGRTVIVSLSEKQPSPNPSGHASGSRPRTDNVVYVCLACLKQATRSLRDAERVRFLAPSSTSEDGDQTSEQIVAGKKKKKNYVY